MKLLMSGELKDRDGEVIQFNGKPLTLERAICVALDGGTGENLSLEEKVKRFKLACKIHGQALPVELTIAEADLIQKTVNAFFTAPIVVGQVVAAMEEATNMAKPNGAGVVKDA